MIDLTGRRSNMSGVKCKLMRCLRHFFITVTFNLSVRNEGVKWNLQVKHSKWVILKIRIARAL
jgi:hypothetical protein